MATKYEKLQAVWHQCEEEREHAPTGTREAVVWAVTNGLLDLPEIDPFDALATEMAQALRAEYKTDSKGRRYRVNHAARVTKNGVQYTFWAEMGYAPHSHMEKAFTQRREAIVSDCVQLKTDVDVYNEMVSGTEEPIQLVLDFTDDVAERQLIGGYGVGKAA